MLIALHFWGFWKQWGWTSESRLLRIKLLGSIYLIVQGGDMWNQINRMDRMWEEKKMWLWRRTSSEKEGTNPTYFSPQEVPAEFIFFESVWPPTVVYPVFVDVSILQEVSINCEMLKLRHWVEECHINLKPLTREELRIGPEWCLVNKYIGYITAMQWCLVIYPVGTEITIAHPAMTIKHNMAAASVPSIIVVLKTEKKPQNYNMLLYK